MYIKISNNELQDSKGSIIKYNLGFIYDSDVFTLHKHGQSDYIKKLYEDWVSRLNRVFPEGNVLSLKYFSLEIKSIDEEKLADINKMLETTGYKPQFIKENI
jgi:hypothetical protein